MAKIQKISPVALQMLENARSFVGVTEDKAHKGKQVSAFLRSVLVYTPERWDMAFIYFCLWEACISKGIYMIPLAATTSPIAQWEFLQRNAHKPTSRYYTTDRPIVLLHFADAPPEPEDLRKGDIFLMHDDGVWRAGIIDNPLESPLTIEGCVSHGPSKKIGVYNKKRKLAHINRIIRINL